MNYSKNLFKSLVLLLLSLLLLNCRNGKQEIVTDTIFYNSIIDQIIYDNLYTGCIIPSKALEKIYQKYVDGQLDLAGYYKTDDSLKQVRKKLRPKCLINLSNDFRWPFDLNESLGATFKTLAKEEFIKSYFSTIDYKRIVDTISQPFPVNIGQLDISYIEVKPYKYQRYNQWGDGIGVMSVSQIFFSKDFSRGVLYYEYHCGPKCAFGEIVFIEKQEEKWKVIKYNRAWDS